MKTSFALYRALLSVDVSEDKARDVVDALEQDMKDTLATKTDLKDLELRLTMRMFTFFIANLGAMVGILKMMLPAAG